MEQERECCCPEPADTALEEVFLHLHTQCWEDMARLDQLQSLILIIKEFGLHPLNMPLSGDDFGCE